MDRRREKQRWTARDALGSAKPGLFLCTLWLAVTILSHAAAAQPAHDRSRVLSVGGSITEILYALGLEKNIAAVDTTSIYPPAALADHPNIGYMRALSAEGVLSVSPTLILMEPDAGPQGALDVLEGASIPLVRVPDDPTAEGIAAKIRKIGEVMDARGNAEKLASAVMADMDSVETAVAQVEDRLFVLFILSTSGGRILAAGEGTSADAMIKLAGGRNAFGEVEGYKPASMESMVDAAPDVIVTINRGEHEATVEEIANLPSLSGTPAAKNRRIVVMNGLYLLGFGPRTAHAVRDLFHALYPDQSLPALKTPSAAGATAHKARP